MGDGSDNTNLVVLDTVHLKAYRDDLGNFAPGYKPIQGPSKLLSGNDLWVYKTTSYGIRGESAYAFMDSWDFHKFELPFPPLVFAAQEPGTLGNVENDVHKSIAVALKDKNVILEATVGPRIQHLALGQVIDIIFENAPTEENENGMFSAEHPNHIHGHYFWVLGEGLGSFSENDATHLNFIDPPQRDNVLVKPNSWTAVRLEASNPGLWLMHCHTETHANFGMATVLMVGNSDEHPKLPTDFPRCVHGNGMTAHSVETSDLSQHTSTTIAKAFIFPLVLFTVLFVYFFSRKQHSKYLLDARFHKSSGHNKYGPMGPGRDRQPRPRSMSVPPMPFFREEAESSSGYSTLRPEGSLRYRAYMKLKTVDVV
jgi:hypothetical protein